MDVSDGSGGADRKPEIGQNLRGGFFAAMPRSRIWDLTVQIKEMGLKGTIYEKRV